MDHHARLTSTSSDRVKSVRSLHSRQGRRKVGRFLVEGPQAVRSALSSGVVVHELFVEDDARLHFPDIVEAAKERRIPLIAADQHVLAAMSETKHSQGVLAVCDQLPGADLDAVLAVPAPVLILDGVSDPGNVGTILRTAEAVGASAVVLTSGCADIHNGKVIRSTTGSVFRVPVVLDVAMADVIAAVRRAGRALVVATGDGEEDLFTAVDSRMACPRACWVIGSEAHGVGDEAVEAADLSVRIPMAEGVESLNAAVSAAAILYVLAHGARSGAFGPHGFR